MIKPQRMSRLLIIGSKSRLAKVVGKLHELEAAHIIEHKKDEFDLCAPMPTLERVSALVVQVRSLISALGIDTQGAPRKSFRIPELERQVAQIKEETTALLEKRKGAQDELLQIAEQKRILGNLAALSVSSADFSASRHIKAFIGIADEKKAKSIQKGLSALTESLQVHTAPEGKGVLMAIFIDAKLCVDAGKILAESSFSETDVSAVKGLLGDPKELIAQLSKKEIKLTLLIDSNTSRLGQIAKKHSGFLGEADKFLSIEAEKAQAPLSFGSTRESFFLRCYVPTASLEHVKKELHAAAAGSLHIADEELGDEEDTPIKLDNPKPFQSFEFFTNLYSLPKYNEFDPTMLMAFTFPLFFGFMLGDVGYGLITLALFFWLRRKVPEGRQFFNILMAASASSILFGVLYGEVFGFEPWHGVIVRTHDFDALMAISIIAGAVQVNLGLVLGFILERHHGLMHAVYAKLSWIVLEIAVAVLYASYNHLIPLPIHAGYALLVIALLMLYKGEGYMGLMEIPSLLSHIVSYARLMAVGLASVFIAVMVNDLTTFLLHKGVLWVPLALVALIIGHTFNIALGILSPSLHSIRLHYVEFFTKFYKGGGKEYVPFGAQKQKSLF